MAPLTIDPALNCGQHTPPSSSACGGNPLLQPVKST